MKVVTGETEIRALLELRVLVAGEEQVGLEVWGRDSGGYAQGGSVFWLPFQYKDRLMRAAAAFGEAMEKDGARPE